MFLGGEELLEGAVLFNAPDPDAEAVADQRRGDDAEREQPLKHAGAFTAIGGAEAFGEIKRDDHSDQSGTHPLQQTSHHQRAESLGQGDHRDARHKHQATDNHHRLAADQIGQHPCKQRGNDTS